MCVAAGPSGDLQNPRNSFLMQTTSRGPLALLKREGRSLAATWLPRAPRGTEPVPPLRRPQPPQEPHPLPGVGFLSHGGPARRRMRGPTEERPQPSRGGADRAPPPSPGGAAPRRATPAPGSLWFPRSPPPPPPPPESPEPEQEPERAGRHHAEPARGAAAGGRGRGEAVGAGRPRRGAAAAAGAESAAGRGRRPPRGRTPAGPRRPSRPLAQRCPLPGVPFPTRRFPRLLHSLTHLPKLLPVSFSAPGSPSSQLSWARVLPCHPVVPFPKPQVPSPGELEGLCVPSCRLLRSA